MELLGVFAFAQLRGDGGCLDNLDARKPNTVTGCHLVVHLFDGTVECGVPVFLVHVVVPSSALVPQPDAIVLDFCWVPFKYLHIEGKLTYKLTSCHEMLRFLKETKQLRNHIDDADMPH